MKTLQIRNVPDEVHRELRVRAAAAGMSLSDYVLEELARTASRPPISETLRRAGGRSGRTPGRQEIVEAIRSERERG